MSKVLRILVSLMVILALTGGTTGLAAAHTPDPGEPCHYQISVWDGVNAAALYLTNGVGTFVTPPPEIHCTKYAAVA